jgi:hypothetical protein
MLGVDANVNSKIMIIPIFTMTWTTATIKPQKVLLASHGQLIDQYGTNIIKANNAC